MGDSVVFHYDVGLAASHGTARFLARHATAWHLVVNVGCFRWGEICGILLRTL